MKLIKAFWNGLADCLWHMLPLVIFAFGIWLINDIRGESGVWYMSLLITAIVCLIGSVAMIVMFGNTYTDYCKYIEEKDN